MSSILKVDTISEKTTASGVTIDGVLVKDGAIASSYISGLSGGKVLQVVNSQYTTETGNTTTTYADTGLSATITPSSTSSKILVLFTHNTFYSRTSEFGGTYFKLLRGATDLYSIQLWSQIGTGTPMVMGRTVNGTHLDSPATTSAITYKTQFKVHYGTNSESIKVAYGASGNASPIDSMILLEIAG